MRQFKKTLLIICIALSSAIFFNLSHANTATWQPTSTVREGSTSVYTGQQHKNKETHQGIAKFRPTAQQVGKAIVRTGAVLAVDLAIQQLLNGVDYVLDPKLQKLKFPDIYSGESSHNRTGKCAVALADNMNAVDVPVKDVPNRLAELLKKHNYDPAQVHSCSVANKYHTYLQCDTTIHSGKKTYRFQCWPYSQQKSYDEIGEQILKDADAGKPEAIDYVATVADELATQQEKEKQKQWEATRHLVASAKDKEDEGAGATPNDDLLQEIALLSQHGKNDIVDTGIRDDYNAETNNGKTQDRCEWLKANKHRYPAKRVTKTEKAWKCRHSRQSKD